MPEEYQEYECIHRMVEAEAARRPGATALVCGGREMSYGELNRRANRVAHRLRAFGLGPEEVVGLLLPRGFRLVEALLGVLKAGGAYLCLDAEYPAARIGFMLEDAGARLVLGERAWAARVPDCGREVVYLDEEQLQEYGEDNPESTATAESLAYVTYTSGSTGTPKGTQVLHRNVPGFMFGIRYAHFAADQTFLQHSSISWDAMTLELWTSLLHGARCVLYEGEFPTPQGLAEAVRRYGVTTLYLTCSLFNAVVDAAPEALEGVTQLIVGGEAMSVRHVRAAMTRWPGLKLVNGYGPSECTVVSACYPIKEMPDEQARAIPIGRPVGDRKVYLLDRRLRRVPIGATGEIYIGGPGVARGYLNRPDLTAERFVPDHFSGRPGQRLYRTGDLARYLPDGNLEFLGRADQQVKVRGFRIELGEIEAALSRHPAVRQSVVLAREDEPGQKRLVAYVVGDGAHATGDAGWREYLRERMPEYMIPSAFVVLDELPLTPNGKLDRAALPSPEQARLASPDGYAAPRTPVEDVLVGIWSEVLGVERVGVGDNFFQLGGHSLMATRVTSRVREIFQVDIPVRKIFELPTLAMLAEAIEEGYGAGRLSPAPPIRPAGRERPLPLSYAQQRLWFIHQLDPDSSAYNMPLAVRMNGALDVPVLERTLNEILRRHESLRTTFDLHGEEPVQAVMPPRPLDLAVEDVTALPPPEREAAARRLAAEEARAPFDLSRGPLLRVRLLKTAEDEHVALLTMHHIVSDGWSMGVLVREVATLYEAFRRGEQSSPLPELPVQYADYAAWQREWLRGEVLAEQLAYWKEQLGPDLPVLQLPTSYPRPAAQTFNGASLPVELGRGLAEELKALSRREGATLFMTLLAAFDVLLSRYTGQEDIVVGTPIANRNRAEVENLIGFFVNTLVLRTDLSGNPTFRELLARVRETALGAYAHQDVPFEKLVEELQPGRDLSRNPLAQVVFALQNAPMGDLNLSELKLSPLETKNDTAKFDLELHLVETDEGIGGSLVYNTDLFTPEAAGRMAENFRQLVEGIAARPDAPLSELSSLSGAEAHQLLVEWNDSATDYPRDRCMHELFAEHAARAPEAPAVVCGDEQVTYGELERRANRLAHYLRRRGVAPEMPVGVMMESSVDLMTALLAVLKAGGAYVPLDSNYPKQRLDFMVKDAGLRVLLTKRAHLDSLPESPARPICLDAEREAIARESEEAPAAAVTPENLANVIYTSGSAGQPKGACLLHRAVNRLVVNPNYMTLKASDRIAQASNFSFDAATFEIWGALLNGACLVVTPREVALSAAELDAHLRRHRVNVLFLTTALFNHMARNVPPAFAALDYLIFGGEAADPHAVREMLAKGGQKNLLHAYGPAESTTYATCYPVREVAEGATTVPIGRPVTNTQTYLLDRSQRLAPVGATGELYIGGDGLARGYLGRPELTAERFVPDPFAGEPGARLYRTGDLARHLPDGNLEFLGRADQQVKVRGFRVEPGEIEAVLGGHPAVQESCVVARGSETGEKRLAAYVVAGDGGGLSTGALRLYLKERLPEYMIPSAFVVLDELPLTPNGKVDLRALPDPDGARPGVESDYAAPRTAAERKIAALWQELLRLDTVGIHDNFFDLGGHSLLLVKMNKRLQETFGAELPMIDMFRYPTVSALAQRLDGRVEPEPAPAPEAAAELAESVQQGRSRLSERLARSRAVTLGEQLHE